MRLLIDADACPVMDIAVSLCKEHGTDCILFCDTAHHIEKDGAVTVVIDKGADSADFALANRVCAGDIVITQDYGLASMCLARTAKVLHQDGWEYTENNINALLLQRYEARRYRTSGGHTKGQKKRTAEQNEAFTLALKRLLQTTFQG